MKHKGLIIAGVILGVILLMGGACYGSVNSTRNTGIQMEQQLAKEYEDNQNHLSAYISSFYEQLGVANLKSAKLDSILTHAVTGRYGEDGFQANGAFFAAVSEAYPDLTANLNLYDRILEHVQAGRENYRARQSKLLDQTRAYRVWLEEGLVRHMVVQNVLGFPSQKLEARVGGQSVAKGWDALAKIEQIVVTGSTVDAYTSGRMEPLTPK